MTRDRAGCRLDDRHFVLKQRDIVSVCSQLAVFYDYKFVIRLTLEFMDDPECKTGRLFFCYLIRSLMTVDSIRPSFVWTSSTILGV